MTVLMSLGAALAIGVADFFGAIGGRRGRVLAITLWVLLLSWGPIALIAFVVGGHASAGDYLLGALAGVAGGVGLLTLYAGYAHSAVGVVGPSAAVVSAVVPVAVGIAIGDPSGPLTLAGTAVGLVAIALIGWAPQRAAQRWQGLGYGLAAGVAIGLLSVGLGLTNEKANVLPVISMRLGSFVVLLSIARIWKRRLMPLRASWPYVVLAATGSTIGISLFTVAAQENLVVAGLLLQMMYAVSAILAVVFLDERPTRQQIVGLALAAIAVAFVSIG